MRRKATTAEGDMERQRQGGRKREREGGGGERERRGPEREEEIRNMSEIVKEQEKREHIVYGTYVRAG